MSIPRLWAFVLDTTDARRAAEFYRHLLNLKYRPGDEPPPPGTDDEKGRVWLQLVGGDGAWNLSFQQTAVVKPTTWPDAEVPQQMHLDTAVDSLEELDRQHERVLSLGGVVRFDRRDDPEEPLLVFADPDGHTFCIFVQ
ncbi:MULTISPECIES: VOC family protein [Actinoplanes]|uniref:VOC family protein n=1 Tax=Actinoplanes TaxID=1865 RepID=UPI0005F2E23F|nr:MULTISPECIES: VOC family protein [Actinoplanes]GLX99640.1 glyoxalase [Actinoplanes sp. NBRC 101535]